MDPFVPVDPPTEELFDRYLAGQATAEEAAKVQAYINHWGSNATQLLKQPSVVHLDPSEPAGADLRSIWADVATRIAKESTKPSGLGSRYSRGVGHERATPWRGVIVAVVLVVLGLGFLGMLRESGWNHSRASATTAVRVVTTQLGQQARFRLPDGSSVILAPGSTLRYAPEFGRDTRDIELQGQALFTVTRDNGAPFLVRTAATAVRVLGTTFAVRQYTSDTAASIVVAEGRVSTAAHVLTSGDAAVVSSGHAVQVSHGVDIATTLAWTTGTLAFQRVSLRVMIPELERWYGVRISVSDQRLLDQVVTMTFLIQSPDDAFNSLASLLHAHVIRTHDDVLFEGGR